MSPAFWLVWLIVYAAFAVAVLCLVGTNRRTATHPPCPDCGTPLNPTHWCGTTNGADW